VNPQNPWLRFLAGVVAVAVAIRVTIDLLRPVLGYLIALLVIAGFFVVLRWWNNRW
jgi:hypothetical protein